MEKKKIYLDKNGYQQYLKEIDDLRNELDNLEKDNVTTYLNNLEYVRNNSKTNWWNKMRC